MFTTLRISGFRRPLAAAVGVCAFLVAAPAFAQNGNGNGNGGGNGNGCNAPGKAYGHDNCDPPPPPPAEPAPESAPPAPESPATEQPAPDTDAPTPEPSGEEPPGADVPASEEAPPADEQTPPPAATPGEPKAQPAAPSLPTPATPAPAPAPPVAGWAPATSRPDAPAAKPVPSPTARRGRTFSSAPEASWSAGERGASWGRGAAQPKAEDYGVAGNGALITIKQRHGVFGGLSFRVSMAPGSSTYVFRAARSVVAGAGGRLYRIRAWLRSDVPGLTVCLRIQEVAKQDPLTSVRTSESCLSPNAGWKRFNALRTTLARGNRLVFSIYSFGAVAGDSFEVNGFIVERRVKNGWKQVDAVFGDELREY